MTDLWGWSVAIIPWLQRITVEHVWIPIGSMVLVYMLTWLGYIDGIHVTIYSIHGSYGIWTIDHWFGSTAKKALCCWWKIIMFNDVTKGWIVKSPYYDILVGGFNHLEKYESQWEGLTHIIWKIKMFQTTNQYIIYIYILSLSHWYQSLFRSESPPSLLGPPTASMIGSKKASSLGTTLRATQPGLDNEVLRDGRPWS